MRKTFLLFFLFFSCSLLFSPDKVFAAFSFNILSVSTATINSGNQEITVELSISDLPSESYFRVALQKTSGGSYFGYIQNNNGDWATIQSLSGDCSIYYKVTDTNTSSLQLKYKVGDDTTIDSTSYKLKAHRFTKTCTSYTEATNSADMTLNFPTPTPTPTPTTQSSTATPTPAKTPSPSPIKTTTPSPKPTEDSSIQILAFDTSPTPENKPQTAVLGQSSGNAGFYFILSGALLLVAGLYIFIRKNKFSLKDKIGI